MRSRAAASVLQTEGFKTVHSMMGGINAWEGLSAQGLPDAGMSWFPDTARPEEMVALAWLLEEGSQNFYTAIPKIIADREAGSLFNDLVQAEEHHKQALQGLYRDMTGQKPGPDFPQSALKMPPDEERMEGGMDVREALAWAQGKKAAEILELALGLETDSYDLYLKMSRKFDADAPKKLFTLLAAEEKKHLDRLSALLDRKV